MNEIEALQERIDLLTKALKRSEKRADRLQRILSLVKAVVSNG